MKKQNLCLLLLLFLIVTPSVGAISNQGLYWAVAENQLITYNVNVKDDLGASNREYSYQIYVDIVEISDIPKNITDFQDIIFLSRIEAMYINESVSPPPLEFYFAVKDPFVLPIGNWTLMTELCGTYYNLFGDAQPSHPVYWGYNYTRGLNPPYEEINTAVTYTKADGVLQRLEIILTNLDEEAFTVVIERIPEFPIAIVLGIVVIGAVAVVAIIVYVKMKR